MPYSTKEKWNNEIYSACAYIVDENNTIVASVYGYDKRGYRLATAAPEMYELLVKILDDTQNGQSADENTLIALLNSIDGKDREFNPFYPIP